MKQLMEKWRQHLTERGVDMSELVQEVQPQLESVLAQFMQDAQFGQAGDLNRDRVAQKMAKGALRALADEISRMSYGSKESEYSMAAEGIDLDIEVGDILLGGKYKNKRIEVKEIGRDELGQPTVNGKPILKVRIEKHLPDDKKSKKTLDKEKENNA